MLTESLLISGLTTLGLMLGYSLVKRIRRSKCAMDMCGCKIDSLPEQIELQKKETERLISKTAHLPGEKATLV